MITYGGSRTSPLDRLRVFVSSCIAECRAERRIAREAIASINHDSVLFEESGARPYPPRELYTARLEASHVFVAIYRHSYGWVAPDMTISGIEDEFRIASRLGMDRLIYVSLAPGQREHRLAALIESAKPEVVIAFYTDPSELYERIRDDVTAVISARFVNQGVGLEEDTPVALLDSILPNPNHRIRRARVEKAILEKLDTYGRIVIVGGLGSGKTVLLATLAAGNGWIFVDGRGLNRLELTSRIANALWLRLGQQPLSFATEQAARTSLLRAWQALEGQTLAVDSPEDNELLAQLSAEGGRRIAVTSRARLEVPGQARLEVPPLDSSEIEEWLSAFRGRPPGPLELAGLTAKSHGNPLYLRFYASGATPREDLTLRELEVRAAQALSAGAREVLSYLVISGIPLPISALGQLIGLGTQPEAVADYLAEAGVLISQSRAGAEIVHEHSRETLLAQLHEAPTRLAFFGSRIGKFLEDSGNYVAAFHALQQAGEDRKADTLLDRAAHQVTVHGGGVKAIGIFQRVAERGRELGRASDETFGYLFLASALHQTGDRAGADVAVALARTAAESSSDGESVLYVRETELVLDVGRQTADARIASLQGLREEYSKAGKSFDAARLASILSAEYVFLSNYEEAERFALEAMKYFQETGDEYGTRISELNLAVAMSGIPGRQEEATDIARRLEREISPSEYPRERAIVCNLLTRRYRELGDRGLAEKLATEAIEIGEQLQDYHVVAVNRINLGNVYRDGKLLGQALTEYRIADQKASAGGFRSLEASANELIASVLNQQEDYGLALIHAQHAVSLARLAGDSLLEARAHEELAAALEGKGETLSAVDAYSEAAGAAWLARPKGAFFVRLVGEALGLAVESGSLGLTAKVLGQVFVPDLNASSADQLHERLRITYRALPEIMRRIEADKALAVVALATAALLRDLPKLVCRRIVIQAVNELLDTEPKVSDGSLLVGIAAILTGAPKDILTLGDLVDLAERVATASDRVSFKPQSDGSAHWNLRLRMGTGVLVTVTQLDESERTAATAFIISLFLAGLADRIREEVLETDQLVRNEVVVNVMSRDAFENRVQHLERAPFQAGFVVSRSTDVMRADQPPIVLICEDTFGSPWHPERELLSDVHLAFAEVLKMLTFHFLSKEIEPEVLHPKIIGFIRNLGLDRLRRTASGRS